MDDIAKLSSAQEEILALARKHRITYEPTPLDELGNAITRLAGNNVELDQTELVLLALRRTGRLSTQDADRLHIAYMRQRAP
jgi:hypothetical protein